MTRPVVVLGDGPAGVAAATTAARRGRPALLVGRGRTHPPGTLEMLSGRATAALVALGWYERVTARAAACDAIVSQWRTEGYVERPSVLEPGELGWIVDRAWLDPLLRDLAIADGVAPCEAAATGDAEVVVVATGKHAPGVGRRLGPDMAALTVLLPSAAVEGLVGRLLVDAAHDGWWSALDDGASLAVSYTTATASLVGGRPIVREVWRRAVARAPWWLPRSTADADLRIRPIRSRLVLGEPGSPRVGDAALCVDPLSGHGLTLALEGGLRCLDQGYPEWLVDQAEAHESAGRAAYEAGGLRHLLGPSRATYAAA